MELTSAHRDHGERTMSDLRTAWTEVANKLEGLGQHLKERTIEAKESTAKEKEALDNAAKDFAASVQNACAAVEDAVSDPDTRRQAGEVGRSVVAALATTLEEVSQQLRSRLETVDSRASKSSPPAVERPTGPSGPAAVE
jgi:hypothetical protein